jgi:hypothetical protein
MNLVGPTFSLPANSSRFFSDRDRALEQPLGRMQLAIQNEDPWVFNSLYQPDLIMYDEQYCTAVSAIGVEYTVPTLTYIDKVLDLLSENPKVIDIGCGQGELVFLLRRKGVEAFGYDPVARVSSPFLRSRYWEASDVPGDLYVMRCVLPHIESPWEFISEIALSSPRALILIEFQRLEWILENAIWYQVSHDHVNVFSIEDFVSRYEIVKSGTYSNGEWGWVLINPSKPVINKMYPHSTKKLEKEFTKMFNEKDIFLSNINNKSRAIVIWGAAGKGIVLANALQETELVKYAIDADKHRWNLYLEGSGVQVLSPNQGMKELTLDTIILVCNPNHIDQVKGFVGENYEVTNPRDLDIT